MTKPAPSNPTFLPARGWLAIAVLSAALTAGCFFGGDDDPETPEATNTLPAPPAIGRSGATATPTPFGGVQPRPTITPTPQRGAVEGPVSIVYSFPFIWPAEGPITSFMDPEHPNGIDIGLDNGGSLDVRASAGGAVTFTGGSEDEALGLSIVIDHGNGITTVYGHLDEILVDVGDDVEVGELIAIGGSTGISTGNHLHFEVRKNGDTVDPLHVLPTQGVETSSFVIDCAVTPFAVPSGAHALVDLGGVLNAGERVVQVAAVAHSGGPELDYRVESDAEVRVITPVNFDGPDGLDTYELQITVDNGRENFLVECGFVVQRREVPTTFYVRAVPPADDVAVDEDGAPDGSDDTALPPPADGGADPPENTPTPGPWPQAPAPTAPAASGGGAAAPAAPGASGGGSSAPTFTAPGSTGPGASPPSYGVPGQTATPSPQ